jgi:integrase
MAGRRPNGEGTVFQRKDGRWVTRLSLGNGKYKYHYFKTQREALKKRTFLLAAQQAGLPVDTPERLTLGNFLTEWLETVVRPKVKASTFISYEVEVRRHLTPGLGTVKLSKLRPQQIQAYYQGRLSAGCSPQTVQYQHKILRSALKTAVRWGLVARNVGEQVDAPRVPRRPVRAFSIEEARQFVQAVVDDRLEALYVLTLTSGLRRGEVLALKWEDVDFEAGTLAVRRTFGKVKGGWELTEPKTPDSRRVVKPPALALESLKRQRARQLEQRLKAGAAWQDSGLIFTTTIGTAIDGDNLRKEFQKKLRDAGLEPMPFHSLRHSAATLMLALGVQPKVVSEMLGHSRISITMDTYSHVLPHMQDEAADRLNALLKSGSQP